MKIFPLCSLIISAIMLAACTQEPSSVAVSVRGNNFYGKNAHATAGRDAQSGFTPEYNQTYTQDAAVGSVGVTDLEPVTVAPSAPISVTESPANEEAPPAPLAGNTTAREPVVKSSRVAEIVKEPVIESARADAAQENILRMPSKPGVYEPSTAMTSLPEMENVSPLPDTQQAVPVATLSEKPAMQAPVQKAVQQPAAPQKSASAFIMPVEGEVTDSFGEKTAGQYNDGITIAAAEGEPIWAAADGMVVFASDELKDYGNMVILRHEGGLLTSYAHASSMSVKKGDSVKQGDMIGTVGSTGAAKTAQLFFSVRKGRDAVDPSPYLNQDVAQLKN